MYECSLGCRATYSHRQGLVHHELYLCPLLPAIPPSLQTTKPRRPVTPHLPSKLLPDLPPPSPHPFPTPPQSAPSSPKHSPLLKAGGKESTSPFHFLADLPSIQVREAFHRQNLLIFGHCPNQGEHPEKSCFLSDIFQKAGGGPTGIQKF